MLMWQLMWRRRKSPSPRGDTGVFAPVYARVCAHVCVHVCMCACVRTCARR